MTTALGFESPKDETAADCMKYKQYPAWEEETSENKIWIFLFFKYICHSG